MENLNESEVVDAGTAESPSTETTEGQSVESEGTPGQQTAETGQAASFDGDINKLSPELQQVAKGFQADYTRKTQALQTALDGLKSHQARLDLLDRAISGDPTAREALASMFQRTAPAKQEQDEALPEQFASVSDMVKFLDGRFQGIIQKHLEGVVQQHLQPVRQHIDYQRAQAEFDAVKTEFPDLEDHIDAIIKVREENPGIKLRGAYILATHKKAIPASAAVSKPGKSATAVKPKAQGNMTWEESVRAASEILKTAPM